MRTRALAATLLLGVLTGSPARADDEAAAARFHDGEAAFGRHEYKAAGDAFEAAFRESPSGAAKYAAALAWEAAGDLPRAADDYERAASLGGLDRAQVKDVEVRLGSLKKKLGRIEVRAREAKVSVDDAAPGDAPYGGYVIAGDHSVSVTFSETDKRVRTVHVDPGATLAIDLDAPAVAPPPVTTPPPPARPSPPPPPPPRSSALRTVGFVSIGVGAACVLAAIPIGVAALGARDTFNASGFHDGAAHDQAATLRTVTNVAWIAGAVAVAGGVTLVIVAPRSRGAATARVTAGAGSLALDGRF